MSKSSQERFTVGETWLRRPPKRTEVATCLW